MRFSGVKIVPRPPYTPLGAIASSRGLRPSRALRGFFDSPARLPEPASLPGWPRRGRGWGPGGARRSGRPPRHARAAKRRGHPGEGGALCPLPPKPLTPTHPRPGATPSPGRRFCGAQCAPQGGRSRPINAIPLRRASLPCGPVGAVGGVRGRRAPFRPPSPARPRREAARAPRGRGAHCAPFPREPITPTHPARMRRCRPGRFYAQPECGHASRIQLYVICTNFVLYFSRTYSEHLNRR